MDQVIKETLAKIIFMVVVSIYGLMEESILEIGIATKCTARALSHGKMAESTKDNITKTLNKVTVSLLGLTNANTTDFGSTINKKDQAST
jgi:hypothetical protein